MNMVLAVQLEVVYAHVGSLARPQAKIVGARYRFEKPHDVHYLCTGPDCAPGGENMSQPLEVVAAVSFVDASRPSIVHDAERTRISERLPSDFWYPFS